MLRVTPIYGSRWSNVGEAEDPCCTLVEYGGCRVLWNVGWCAEKDAASFPVLPDHDCLVLTDSTLEALGGLPLYYQQMVASSQPKDVSQDNSKDQNNQNKDQMSRIPPIYATFPTVKMGQMTLYDQHAAVSFDGGMPAYSLQDLDRVFSAIVSIKYSQYIPVHHPLTGQASVTVTAHRAGHAVGGAFYVLQRLVDETVVVLTSTYHIAKELHLDSSTLLQHGSTPDVLVTRAGGPAFRQFKALSHGPKPHALPSQLITQAERGLSESILAVLRRDGNVLLPTDASGRVLELLLLLNQHWERHRLQATYNLVWLGPMVTNTAEFARCQLEWMATSLGSQFDSMQTHPYNLKAVRCCSSLRELEAVMEENQNPTCVLATGLSLERGPARDVFLKFADNPDNAVILTDSSQAYLRAARSSQSLHSSLPSSHGQVVGEATRSDAGVAETSLSSSAAVVKMETDELVQTTTAVAAADIPAVAHDALAAAAAAAIAAVTATTTTDPDDVAAEGEGQEGMVGLAVTELSEWTTAGQLLSAWAMAKAAGREMDDSVVVDVQVPVRAPLVGPELKAFIADEEAARLKQKKQAEKRAMLREVELAKGQLRLGEEENVGAGGQLVSESNKHTSGGAASSATGGGGGGTRPRKKSRFDSSLFLKFSKPLHCKCCESSC
jgi:cleavage and polyadenylation specificity factor subunit 2